MKSSERLNVIIITGVLVTVFAIIAANSFTATPAEIKEKYSDLIMVIVSGLIGFLSRGASMQSAFPEPKKEEKP